MLKQLVASYLSSILFLGQPLPPLNNTNQISLHLLIEDEGNTWLNTLSIQSNNIFTASDGQVHIFGNVLKSMSQWYTDTPHRSDFNNDDVIDSQDLQIFLSTWGPVDD